MINYPIVLTNMNRLTTTKRMVEDLFRLNGNADIIIIDNDSTYPPLLEWYIEIKNDVKIIKNPDNRGPWTFFYTNHNLNINSDVYIYSDADLELNTNMPYNWQEIMLDVLNRYKRKASLVLRIDDIPDYYEFKDVIKDHQSVCWVPTSEKDLYLAITDMTFSMDYKSNGYRYESVRMGGDFACKHVPWYIDFNNVSDEEKYYLNHINPKYSEALYSNKSLERIKSIDNQ